MSNKKQIKTANIRFLYMFGIINLIWLIFTFMIVILPDAPTFKDIFIDIIPPIVFLHVVNIGLRIFHKYV